MLNAKYELYNAKILRVIGPDLMEAEVDLGFGLSLTKRLKLGGIDAAFVRSMTEEQRVSAIEFLRSRVEGQSVTLRVIRRGELFYARCRYGKEGIDVGDEMCQNKLLEKFSRDSYDQKEE